MNLNQLAQDIHSANIQWWQDPETCQPIQRNKGELIALQHSELSECLEGVRKNLQDDKLPQYPMEVVEQIAQTPFHTEGEFTNTPKQRVVIQSVRFVR